MASTTQTATRLAGSRRPTKPTCASERQHVPIAAILQGVADQRGGDGEQAKGGQMPMDDRIRPCVSRSPSSRRPTLRQAANRERLAPSQRRGIRCGLLEVGVAGRVLALAMQEPFEVIDHEPYSLDCPAATAKMSVPPMARCSRYFFSTAAHSCRVPLNSMVQTNSAGKRPDRR